MTQTTNNLRIRDLAELTPPETLSARLPMTCKTVRTVRTARRAIQDTLSGRSNRMIAIVGPCSVHDPKAALDYATKLNRVRQRLSDEMEVIMRVYFEKPRTVAGWKGLINDPGLDETFRINDGLATARQLLLDLNEMGMPVATEFLDTSVPQYLSDLVSWAAIGARTTESQIHRELASGLSCPVGFKNGTRGDVQIAVDAVRSAAQPHHFLALSPNGRGAVASTSGNADCHIILRGGTTPNYDATAVDAACRQAAKDGIRPHVMIDASHANSGKDPAQQPNVLASVAEQVKAGEHRITGVMIESNLIGGKQTLTSGPLVYGQSITDGCLGWADTEAALEMLAAAVECRNEAEMLPPLAQAV